MHRSHQSWAAGVAAAFLATSAAQAGTLLAGYRVFPVPGYPGGAGVQAYDAATLASKAGSFPTANRPKGLAYGSGGIFVTQEPPGGFAGVTERRNTSGGLTAQRSDDFTYGGALTYGGGRLYEADTYLVGVGTSHFVRSLNNDLSNGGVAFEVPDHVNGLAFGDNSLYLAYDHLIERRDLTGAVLGSTSFSNTFTLGPIAFGGGRLYAGYGLYLGVGTAYGIDALDGLTLEETGGAFGLDYQAEGLAFGEGALFASHDFSVDRFALNGTLTATGEAIGATGALAYIPNPGRPADCPPGTRVCDTPRGGVPEPAAWALAVAGFGLVGTALRRRRAWARA